MKKTIAAAGLIALTATIGLPGLASAADHGTRQTDFVPALSDTRAGGHYEFLKEGLRLSTDSNTSVDKVAEYFTIAGPLPASGAYDWTGTDNQPGAQIVFDTNADRTDAGSFNVLVGEQVYSTAAKGQPLTDWWYTGGSARATARGVVCPSTTGGSGSDCHGTLTAWAAANKTAETYAAGFSLGSGLKGAGLLRSVTLGTESYVFTDDDVTVVTPPAPITPTEQAAEPLVVKTTGSVKVTRKPTYFDRRLVIRFRTDDLPTGAVAGAPLAWKIKIDGLRAVRFTQTAGQRAVFARPLAAGRHTVKVFRNGTKVRTVHVRR